MIYVVATTQVKPDSRDAFIKGAKECIEATRKEKGCIAYDLNRDLEDPTKFLFYERWQSVDALSTHLNAEHTKKLVGGLGKLLEGAPAFHFYQRPGEK